MSEKLASALRKCVQETDSIYRKSQSIISLIKKEINIMAGSIDKLCQNIDDIELSEAEFLRIRRDLKEQLRKLNGSFTQDLAGIEKDVGLKRAHDSHFNITLFGRTMSGKSTLMEIFVHGQGESIGNGGQRTTRDVRKYQWKGMEITDIPGIDAYNGSEDERLAVEAAKSADLIIFLITAGQPESTEADWLVNLKQEDKPVICLCNFKKSLVKPMDRKQAIKRLPQILREMDVPGIKKQFNEFVQSRLPDENIEIFVVNLLAAYLAQQEENTSERGALRELSQFEHFEKALIGQISDKAPFYRFRSYMALIDVPIYAHFEELGATLNSNFANLQIFKNKYAEFSRWKKAFIKEELNNLKAEISAIFNAVRKDLPNFVEDNVESSSLSDKWRDFISHYNLDKRVNTIFNEYIQQCVNKINAFFQSLRTDFEFQGKFDLSYMKSNDITNWKRIWGWSSAIAGTVGAGLALFYASTPLGWVTGICVGLFTFFGWLSDSREKKLKAARRKLYDNLTEELRKIEDSYLRQINQAWEKNITHGLMRDADTRFNMIKNTIYTIFDTESHGWQTYRNNHVVISNNLLKNVMDRIKNQDYPDMVARIPGRILLLVTSRNYGPKDFSFLYDWLDKGERILILKHDINKSLYERYEHLKKIFLKNIKSRLMQNREGKFLIFIPNNNYSAKQADYFNLMQQILSIPVIKVNEEG